MRIVTLLLLSLFFINCQTNKKSSKEIAGEYQGYWARTTWLWTFTGNKFKLVSKGELGNKETVGNYFTRNDSLFLQFSQDDIRPSAHRTMNRDTLEISGDRCLISTDDGYDYCKQKSDNPSEFHFSKYRKNKP